MTVELFTQISNIFFIVCFIVAIAALFISAIAGFKKGIWRVTHKTVFFLVLVIISVCVLQPFVDIMGSLPISEFGVKTLILKRTLPTSEVVTYNVPVTTLFGTLESGFKGYYLLYGLAGSSSSATKLAIALATSVTKWITFFTEMVLVFFLGWIFELLSWHLIFKRIIPKLVRKKIKLPILSMFENVVTSVVAVFLFLAPVTSIINAINNPYSKNEHNVPQNPIMLYVDSFLNEYNNSLFAKTFVNWTANENGLTIDGQVMSYLTSATFDNAKISIIESVHAASEIGSILVDSLLFNNETGQLSGVNYGTILTVETVETLFSTLGESDLFLSIIPIAVDIASSEELMGKVLNNFDTKLLNLSDVKWKDEIGNAQTIIVDLINSGVIDHLLNEDKTDFKKFDFSEFVTSCMNTKTFNKVEHALQTIDDSKLMKRLIPSMISWIASTNETASKYLPTSWDELNDISWGFELSSLLECVHQMYLVNPRIVDVAFGMLSKKTPVSSELKNTPNKAEETTKDAKTELVELLVKDISSYKTILFGETDGNNHFINVDSNGRTIVYENGKKIPGRNYCLFDLQLAKTFIGPVINSLTSSNDESATPEPSPLIQKAPTLDDIKSEIGKIVDELSKGNWRKNFKEEFNAVFYAFESFKSNPEMIASLVNGKNIMPSSGKISDIDPSVAQSLSKALPRMDDSKLLSGIIYPLVESVLLSDVTLDMLADINLDVDLIKAGVQLTKDNNRFGFEMAKLIRSVRSISIMQECLAKPTSNEILHAVGDNSESIAYVLDAFHSSLIINPTRDEILNISGVNQSINDNFYNILSYMFGSALSVPGFSFKEEAISPSIIWENGKNSDGEFFRDRYGNPIYTGETGAIANILKLIGESEIVENLDDPLFFQNNQNLAKLAKPKSEGGYNLIGILNAVQRSNVFSATMGDFLDETLKDMNIVGSAGVTFNNVKDWAVEAKKLEKILLSMEDVTFNMNSLSLTAIEDVVTFNRLLHSLTESSIFVDKSNGDFLFGKWLFNKMTTDGTGLTNLFDGYNLVEDPSHTEWADKWENSWTKYDNYVPAPTGLENYSILYNDILSLDTLEDWNSESFDFNNAETKIATYGSVSDPGFFNRYKNVFEYDELGRICELLYWANRALSSGSNPTDMSPEIFDGLLDALNEMTSLRISIYNLYEIARKAIDTQPSIKEYIDLSPAYSIYMIDCDSPSMLGFKNFEDIRNDRTNEIEYLKSLYLTYKNMTSGVIDTSTGNFNASLVDAKFTNDLNCAVKNVNMSKVFHRKGSILYDPSNPDDYKPTVFQNLLSALYLKTDFKHIIYNAENPKDIYYSTVEHLYENNAESKVQWMNNKYFDWRVADDGLYGFNWQAEEIDFIFDAMNAIAGGKKLSNPAEQYVGLKKKTASNGYVTTFSFSDFDISYTANITAVEEILNALNKTRTLYDCVPNSVSTALSGGSIATQFDSLSKVDFGDANLFYHYFDNVTPSHPYNWEAHFTGGDSEDSDIAFVTTLMMEASLYSSDNPSDKTKSIITSFEDIDNANEDRISEFLKDMLHSKIFHAAGPKKTVNSSGDVVDIPGCDQTVFQEIIQQFLSLPDIAANIIDPIHNPKDAGQDLDTKVKNISKTVFNWNVLNTTIQENEINKIASFIDASKSFDTSSLTDVDLTTLSVEEIENLFELMKTMNDSDCLFDCVPNIIRSSLSVTTFTELGSLNFNNVEPYYHYNGTNFNNRYSENEFNCLQEIVEGYLDFTEIVKYSSIDDIETLKTVLTIETKPLETILENMHESGMFHSQNSKKPELSEYTVFEETIHYLVSMTGLDEFIYGPLDGSSRIYENIKEITLRSITHPNIGSATYYHNDWVRPGDNDELGSFLNLLKEGINFLEDQGNLNFNTLDFNENAYSPTSIKNLMTAINRTDFLSDALPVFVEKGFTDIGVTELTKYNGVSYVMYDLNQKQYGEKQNHLGVQVSEIELITDALNNMYKTNGTISSYLSIENVSEFAEDVNDLNGIMEFLQYSYIMNTDNIGAYNFMNYVSGNMISARGVLLYNLLSPSGGTSTLGDYISGNLPVEKIATLSKIFTFGGEYGYEYEALGILSLAGNLSKLGTSEFDGSNFATVASKRDALEDLLLSSYNVDGSGHRSYFASEVISGILNNIVSSEIAHDNPDYGYGEPIYYGSSTYDGLNENTYSMMDETELSGVAKAIDMFEMINGLMMPTPEIPTRNEFITAMNSLDGSVFAKVLWAGEINNKIILMPGVSALNVYEAGFTFSAHSNALANQLGLM